MKRIGAAAGWALAGILLLAGCGRAPEQRSAASGNAAAPIVDTVAEMPNAADNAVNAAAPARDTTADEEAIRAQVDMVYAGYSGPPARPPVSPDFRGVLDQAVRAAADGAGPDPWCACQGVGAGRFAYEIKRVEFAPDGDRARATLALQPGGDGAGRVTQWVALVRTSRGWLIDDLGNGEQMSLKAEIRAREPVDASNAAE